jgi:hypothetical protein
MPEVRPKWKLILVLLVAGGLCVVVVFFARSGLSRRLDYKGKSIEYWFAALAAESTLERDQASVAFDAFGKDSLDFLLSQVTAEVPSLMERSRVWAEENILHRIRIPECGLGAASEAHFRQKRLEKAFGVLGNRAKPATRTLERLLTNPTCRQEAAASLVAVGSTAWPEIQRGANCKNVEIRRVIISALGGAKVEKTNVCNLLLEALKDSDGLVRHYAAYAVGELGVCPNQCVPALTSALDDSDSRVRYISVFALQKFGSNAVPAISAIRRLQNDPEENVRTSAMEIATNLEKTMLSDLP